MPQRPILPEVPELKRRMVRGRWVILVMALIVAGMAGSMIRQLYRSTERMTSVAMRPFTGSAEWGAAFTTRFNEAFAGVPNFRLVEPYTSTATPDPKSLAADLGVRAVLDGKVEKQGNDLLVHLTLLQGRNGEAFWQQQYRGPEAQAIELQNQAIRDICEALQLRFTPDVVAKLAAPPTNSSTAYLAYSRRDWDQALAADPSFPAARAAKALALLQQVAWPDSVSPEVRAEARTLAEQVLRTQPANAAARSALGWIRSSEWQWGPARGEFQAALDSQPGSARWRRLYAVTYLMPTGQLLEARNELQRAVERQPYDAGLLAEWAEALYASFSFDPARERAEDAVRIDPSSALAHFVLHGCAHQQNRPDEEKKEAAWLRQSAPPGIRRLLEMRQLAYDKKRDQLLASLREAVAARWTGAPLVLTSPELEPYRKDADVVSLLREVGF